MHFLKLIAIGLALSGCGAALGGSGQTKSGTPLVGEAVRNPSGASTTFYVRDAAGLECKALVADLSGLFPKPQMNRSTTLHCNDGRKGTALLSFNQPTMRVTMIYSIKGGDEGTVNFSMM